MMISIIIPIYNVQDYIVKCLESVGAQTYEGPMECILVDDCGNDDSALLAEQFMASYKGHVEFRMIHHDHNRGQAAARNTGLEVARGSFIGFVDSDDWIEPNMYDELYAYLSNAPKAIFITSSLTGETPDGSVIGYADTAHYIDGGILTPYQFLKLAVSGKTNCGPCNRLYRRDYFQKPFPEGRICEDFLFLFENSKALLNTDYYFIMTSKSYYHYNIHMGSTTKNEKKTADMWELDFMENMTYVADICKQEYPELYDLQVKRFSVVYYTNFYEIVNNKYLVAKRKQALKKINEYVRIINKSDYSFMTKFDMFIVTHFPRGYEIDRYIIRFRTKIKSLIAH